MPGFLFLGGVVLLVAWVCCSGVMVCQRHGSSIDIGLPGVGEGAGSVGLLHGGWHFEIF